jgi:hypothetical protein
MQGWEGTAALLVAMFGQSLKARRDFNTSLAQWLMLVVGIGLYALGKPPSSPYNEWMMGAVVAGLAINGAASKLAALGLAAKTDSVASTKQEG